MPKIFIFIIEKKMAKEIKKAIANERAGMQCDVEQWVRVIWAFEDINKSPQ